MNLLIVEDEVAAAKHLQRLVREVAPDCNVMAVLESVRETVAWLRQHTPDLIISDIQLADGTSFEIYSQVDIRTPIIFTTAYDEYMQRAFKVNSVDYLLKPIDKEELQAAFDKYNALQYPGLPHLQASLLHMVKNIPYKSRFLVKTGERFDIIPVEQVAYLQAENKIVFLHTANGRKLIVDETLEELEEQMDPSVFFRLNRKYMAPIQSIVKIQSHFNGRLKIELQSCDDNEIFVSKERAKVFKQWLNK